MPIMGLFVLFDMVIHNPKHPENASNLALLDVCAGHFSRLEYASGGSLPGSLIAEFASIAREHVNNVRRSGSGGPTQDNTTSSSTWWQSSPVVPGLQVQSHGRAPVAQLTPDEQIELPLVRLHSSHSFSECQFDLRLRARLRSRTLSLRVRVPFLWRTL